MVQLNLWTPIPVDCCTSINHVTFDGCHYFATVRCQCEILRFDPCCSGLHRYCTCRVYDCICYDYREHCFWASSRDCCGKIFKLDCGMNEIDCISISSSQGIITGISYQCCNDVLIVSFPCTVIQIEKSCAHTKTLFTAKGFWIMDILSICPALLITVVRHNQFYLLVLDKKGRVTCHICIDGTCIPQNLIYQPCMKDCPEPQILAFARKENCYPYLCNCNISPHDLGIIPCPCNEQICGQCCDCKPDCDPCKDIMESVALIETALSHILNAEGEKIQKALATTDDIDKILCVNREVNKTIVNATHLEHTLYAKLSALSDCGLCDEVPDCIGPCCDDEK